TGTGRPPGGAAGEHVAVGPAGDRRAKDGLTSRRSRRPAATQDHGPPADGSFTHPVGPARRGRHGSDTGGTGRRAGQPPLSRTCRAASGGLTPQTETGATPTPT